MLESPWDIRIPAAAGGDALRAYSDCAARGRERMKSRRVAICGLTRNSAAILPRTIQRMTQIADLFGDYRIVVYENDSADNTRELLQNWSDSDPRMVLLSDDCGDPVNLPDRSAGRMERMARYRNRYRTYIAEHLSDFDETIVLDMDLEGGWDLNGIAHTFGCDDWDFVGSYGIIRKKSLFFDRVLQYDAWAYRSRGDDTPLTTKYVNYLPTKLGAPLVPVNSCFGGLGIYRTQALVAAKYAGGDCEHVALHREMRKLGMHRIYLNPNQLAYYGVRLSRGRSLLERYRKSSLVSKLFWWPGRSRAYSPAVNG